MDRELTILSWPDYIDPQTLVQFERQFGARVNIEIASSADEMLARVRTSIEPPDLLCPPDYVVRELGVEGHLLELDHSRLHGIKNLDPRFLHGRAHDPESRFSLIKDWGTTGYMYRTDLVQEMPRTWSDFWELTERFSGQVTVLDSPGEVIGAALKMRGHSYNATEEEALLQAREDLLWLKPHLHAFETDYRPLLAAADAVMSLGWNGDAAVLQAEGVPVRYIIPCEGSQIWEDDWSIAAGARNPDAAYTFLDFVMRPEIAAQEARYTRYATGNRAALALLDASLQSDPATYPPTEVLSRLEPGLPLDPNGAARREALWKEVRR